MRLAHAGQTNLASFAEAFDGVVEPSESNREIVM